MIDAQNEGACCRTCKNGRILRVMHDVSCKIKGVVRPDGHCKSYSPFADELPRRAEDAPVIDTSRFSGEDFSIE